VICCAALDDAVRSWVDKYSMVWVIRSNSVSVQWAMVVVVCGRDGRCKVFFSLEGEGECVQV
jgi:hypothetical protein